MSKYQILLCYTFAKKNLQSIFGFRFYMKIFFGQSVTPKNYTKTESIELELSILTP